MYKRFLMLSLTLLLGAFLLAGCGEDKTDSSKTETTTVSATQTTTAAETKAKSEPTAAQNATTADNKNTDSSSAESAPAFDHDDFELPVI